MTNEERVKIYEDTISYIRRMDGNCEYANAIIYDEQYSFQIPELKYETKIIVDDIDTFEAIKAFHLETEKTCVLNFANAYYPGGAVLKGYSAQEEELCRRSSLHISLTSEAARTFYERNKQCKNLFNDDSLILSPKVIVIKNRQYEILEETISTAVVTMPAPDLMSIQAEAFKKDLFSLYGIESKDINFIDDIKERMNLVLERKIGRILGCMLENGYVDIVLGAWGAGAFGHNAYNIARVFKNVIDKEFLGNFRTIVFAVLDNTEEKVKVEAFKSVFTLHEK